MPCCVCVCICVWACPSRGDDDESDSARDRAAAPVGVEDAVVVDEEAAGTEVERWRRRPRKVEDSVELGFGLLLLVVVSCGKVVVVVKRKGWSSKTRRRLRPRWGSGS